MNQEEKSIFAGVTASATERGSSLEHLSNSEWLPR